MMYFYWTRKGIRPSFFYELPQGELALIRAFYEEYIDEITDMATNIDMKTRDVNIDFIELKLAIICEGVKNPSFRDAALLEHFKVSTPYDLVKLMLTSGERDALYNEIQALSGYNSEVVKEVKK